MNHAKIWSGFFVTIGVCFLVQILGKRATETNTLKGASNYWSTLMRFQAPEDGVVEIALVGSSITGRLPGADQGNLGVANYGVDGGSAIDGLTLIIEGKLTVPETIFVELNTVEKILNSTSSVIADSTRGYWFQLGRKIPVIRGEYRPSLLLYTKMLDREAVLPHSVDVFDLAIAENNWKVSDIDLTLREKNQLEKLDSMLRELSQRGKKVILITYPSREFTQDESRKHRQILERLQTGNDIAHWNLNTRISKNSIKLTDAVHMAPLTAARVMKTLELIDDK